ncbi:MAG: hypothetical protein Q4F75_06665, partial [Pseudomonadota bacterium]|nr:hypothetical protein [Pseudomonadota bacterium]
MTKRIMSKIQNNHSKYTTISGDNTEHRPAAYIQVRENASTGFLPEMTVNTQNHQISIPGTGKNAINGTDEDDNTERRPAAYIQVREDASTGLSPQMTVKRIFPFGVYIHWPYCLSKCPYC